MTRRRSFTVKREPVEAEIGGDLFTAPPVIAPAVLADMVAAGDRIAELQATAGVSAKDQIEQMMKILDEVFGFVLVPDSAKLFHERLYSRTNPFDLIHEVTPALEWLVEEFTNRPSEPSPPSSTGRSDGTSSSTSGAPVEASTPTHSPLTDGATPPMQPSMS